jgi:hypothetical protein
VDFAALFEWSGRVGWVRIDRVRKGVIDEESGFGGLC